MKHLILILISFVALNSYAQERIEVKKQSTKKEQQKLVKGDNAEVLAKTETYKLSKELNLSSEQQQRVYDIFLEHFEQQLKNKEKIKKLIKSKNKENKEDIKQKITKQRSNYDEALNTKLKEVLTVKQFEKYLARNKNEEKIKQKKLRIKN
ncbi:MAG: hypothetical protein ACX93I_04725 [Winogradskyella sp.]